LPSAAPHPIGRNQPSSTARVVRQPNAAGWVRQAPISVSTLEYHHRITASNVDTDGFHLQIPRHPYQLPSQDLAPTPKGDCPCPCQAAQPNTQLAKPHALDVISPEAHGPPPPRSIMPLRLGVNGATRRSPTAVVGPCLPLAVARTGRRANKEDARICVCVRFFCLINNVNLWQSTITLYPANKSCGPCRSNF
jgi:hypothetical protein